ncbi:MAG: hypothetical protein FJ290_21010 [Planctomycetes bacterium]|nr:hypothetical protein [Planctomycetota bacterium]
MTCRGYVRSGVVVLDEPADFREGDEVRVRLARRSRTPGGGTPTLYEQLQDVIGIAEGLPSDLAENHDHYLHGRPKKTT